MPASQISIQFESSSLQTFHAIRSSIFFFLDAACLASCSPHVAAYICSMVDCSVFSLVLISFIRLEILELFIRSISRPKIPAESVKLKIGATEAQSAMLSAKRDRGTRRTSDVGSRLFRFLTR